LADGELTPGELTPGEASELGKLEDSFVRKVEAAEFEERLSKLEKVGQ